MLVVVRCTPIPVSTEADLISSAAPIALQLVTRSDTSGSVPAVSTQTDASPSAHDQRSQGGSAATDVSAGSVGTMGDHAGWARPVDADGAAIPYLGDALADAADQSASSSSTPNQRELADARDRHAASAPAAESSAQAPKASREPQALSDVDDVDDVDDSRDARDLDVQSDASRARAPDRLLDDDAVPDQDATPPEDADPVEQDPKVEAPPPQREPDLWQQFAAVPKDSPSAVDESTPYIAARDVAATETSRTLVTAQEEGASRPPLADTPSAMPTPDLAGAPGERAPPTGGRPERARTRPTTASAAGNHAAVGHEGLGAPTSGRSTREAGSVAVVGGPSQPGSIARATGSTGSARPTGANGRAGVRAGPSATQPLQVRDEHWWQPSIVRMPTSASPRATQPTRSAVQTAARGTAKRARRGTRSEEGGDEREDEPSGIEAIEEKTDDREEDVEGKAEEEEKKDDALPIDPVAALRKALQWGEIERTSIRPRTASPGTTGEQIPDATSAQLAVGEIDPSSVVFISARGTAEGRYREQIDGVIRELWLDADLDVETRAMGIQGDVSVILKVNSRGKVSDVRITAESARFGDASTQRLQVSVGGSVLLLGRPVGELVWRQFTTRESRPPSRRGHRIEHGTRILGDPFRCRQLPAANLWSSCSIVHVRKPPTLGCPAIRECS